MSTWAGIPEEVFQEREYRRGYRDGWIEAANLVADLGRTSSKQRIYDALFDHWEGKLAGWAAGDCSKAVLPPPARSTGK